MIGVRLADLAAQIRGQFGPDWPVWRYQLLVSAWLIAFLLTCNVYLLATVMPAAVRSLGTTVSGIATALIVSPLLTGLLVPAARRVTFQRSRRWVLISSLSVYGVGLVISAASQSALVLTIGFGMVAGLAGAPLLAGAWYAIDDIFGLDRRGFGVLLIGSAPLAATSLGPFFGGFIADESSWRIAFAAELVIVAVIAGLVWLIPEKQTHSSTSTASTGKPHLWGPFAKPRFVAGLLVNLAVGAATVGILYTLLLYFPPALGLDKFQAGAALLPFGIGAIGANALLAVNRGLSNSRAVVVAGIVVSCAGVGVLFLGVASLGNVLTLEPGLLVLGAGNGFTLARLPRLVFPDAAAQDYDEAAGINASVSDFGYSLGIAVLGAVFAGVVAQALITGVEQHLGISLPASDRQQVIARVEDDLRTLTPDEQDAYIESQPPALRDAIRKTFDVAFRDGMDDTLLAALVGLAVGLVVVALLPAQVRSTAPPPA